MRYDDAVASLFKGPLEQFVTERKRLAGELKAAGDRQAAARLAKLSRPPISAWVVDQLWWYARPAFDALFDTAQQLRDGMLEAMAAHRDAIAKLRAEATKILTDAEHGATEATLRRVTQTLAALAAAGGWDPDPPGALSADRDPPGFEAVGISNVIELPATPDAKPKRTPAGAQSDGDGDAAHGHAARERGGHHAHDEDHPARERRDDLAHDHDEILAARERGDHHAHDDDHAARERQAAESIEPIEAARERREAARHRELEAATARAEAAAELRRAEAARAKAAAERHRIEAALRTARGDVVQREREVGKLERELAHARTMVEQAKAVVEGLEDRLAQLDN